MSRKTAPVDFCFLNPDLIVSTTLRSWCDVERLGPKPCCSGMIRLSPRGGTFLIILFSRKLCRELRLDESYLPSSGLSQALGWDVEFVKELIQYTIEDRKRMQIEEDRKKEAENRLREKELELELARLNIRVNSDNERTVQSTKIKSEARELIESFPITNENYPLAIESLVERYGRNELLIDFYVRELKLVLNNTTKKKQDSLSGLYNKLSTQLRALSSLDIQENTGPIEVLLGADVAGKLITGRREELKTGLVALETKLGWTLMGKVPRYTDKKDTSMNIVTMLSQEDIPVSSLWDLEMLGIRDTIEQNSREEKEKVMSHFLETVRQKEDGRYEVHMPWKVDRAFLTDNYELEWLAEGVIEEIPGKELPVRTHYLPHRPVIKETSATSSMKIRPVFDASAKINNHPSLNDCLETGNNLIESVPAILARFRLKPIGVISDIRRAFLQIS
ncbi:uncharacterized protein TNCV_3345041 [Trichonephila clavipes]|nr:uncharacterized protein TNCV_3345041 [Trichonephila clavipes]